MERSYRQQILTLLCFVCLVALTWNATEVGAQGKRARASMATAALSPESVVFTEDFNYTAAGLLTANGWTAHSGGGTNAIAVTSPGLSHAGYAGSGVGNAATITLSGEDVNKSLASPATSGTVYAAFLVNVSSTTALGDYFFHLFSTTTVFRGKVFVKKHATENTFAFGISKNANFDTVSAYTAADYQPGTTYLLVLKYAFVAGDTNDTVSLFVNPVPGAAEPAATLTAGDNNAADVANFPGVGIRQGANSPALTIDGIRVATTWEEAVATAVEPDGKVDLNGDGKSDFLIARTLGGGAAAASAYDSMIRLSRRERFKAMQDAADAGPSALFPIEWWGLENGTSGVHAVQWGDRATDEPITADFDRDGKDDIAVWRPAEENEKAYFYSIDSSNFAFRATAIGQKFDNPYVIGDYDGDGFDDPAVFRCPPSPGTCYFYYLASSVPNSGFYAIPFGLGEIGSVLPYVGDFNGDDKTDYGVATASPSNPSNWIFYIGINGSSDVSGVEWGSVATDRLVPGDFDGDGKTDIVVTRVVNDVMWWYVLEQDGGMQFVPWGQGGDFELIGDYNGDGRDDFAVYRWNAEDATFLIQPSGGGSHFGLTWGLPGDYPVAYFFVQ